jgi:hypothetical protein
MLGEWRNWITRIRWWRWDPVIGIAFVRMFIPPVSTAVLDVFRDTRIKSSIDGCSSSSSTEGCTTARCGVRIRRVEGFLVIIDGGSI